MATKEQEAYLRSLEAEKDEDARAQAARFGRYTRRAQVVAPSGGLSVTVVRAAGQGNPVNAGPINFTVTFSKPATGFTNADISFTGSTVGGTLAAAVTGAGPYNVAVTGMTGNGIVQVGVPAGSATDPTGAPFPASNSATVMFDATAPSVTINTAVGQADPTSTALVNFTVIFSEAVNGFTSSDVSFTGSTATGTLAAAVTGSGATYNVTVTGMIGDGTVVATIPAGAATDAAGNASLASTSTDNTVTFSTGTGVDFPNASNTGVPVGTVLTPVSGDVTISTNGTTFQNQNMTAGMLRIDGNNVTVKNCLLQNGFFWGIIINGTGCIVQDCEIAGAGAGADDGAHGILGSGTFRRLNIHGWPNGVTANADGLNIQDCYIHDMQGGATSHKDCIEIYQSAGHTVQHNTLINEAGETSSVNITNDAGAISNVLINNNKMIGGGVTFYCREDTGRSGGTITNVTVTNNRFGKGTIDYFSVSSDISGAHAPEVWSGNVDDTTGAALASPWGSGGSIGPTGPVAFGSAGTYLTYGTRTNSTLVAPAGIVNGNLLIAFLAVGQGAAPATPTPPAGWSTLTGSPLAPSLGGFFTKYNIFYKIAASESGNYTFTHANMSSCGVVIRYTGVDVVTPFAPTPTANIGSGPTATATGFTTTNSNTFLIFTEQDWGDTATDTTPPTGFTERFDQALLYIADGTLSGTGPTGNISHVSNSTGADPWAAYLIGLKPT